MNDNYVGRALTSATASVFGGVILSPIATAFGQLLVVLIQHLLGIGVADDLTSFILMTLISIGWGLISGFGLIILAIEVWYIVRLMTEEEPVVTFFLVIATCQVALFLCASVVAGNFRDAWLPGLCALAVLGSLYAGIVFVRRRMDAALFAESEERMRAKTRPRSEE